MQYDKNKYKAIKWTNWQLINWLVNPGIATNELILGQRIPKILLIDTKTDEKKSNVKFVPCPHCGNIHSEKLWSKNNAFKNWFGYFCPTCGKTIPCIRNFTSLIIIILTYPIWAWFIKDLKKKWTDNQPDRFTKTNFNSISSDDAMWFKTGVSFGGLMYIISTFINPLFSGEEINQIFIIIGIPIWGFTGLCFGYILSKLNYKPNAL